MGCRVTYDLEEALAEADVINLLRIQHERQRKMMFPSIGEYARLFGLNRLRLAGTKPEAMVMHPGPMNRGVEIESEIADGDRAVILEQVTNGIAIRMAALYLVNGGQQDAFKDSPLRPPGSRQPHRRGGIRCGCPSSPPPGSLALPAPRSPPGCRTPP